MSPKCKSFLQYALMYYQRNADYDEQVEVLNLEGHEEITLDSDPDTRACLFEQVISKYLREII